MTLRGPILGRSLLWLPLYAAFIALAAACSGGGNASPTAPAVQAGDAGLTYPQPVLLVPGDYMSPATSQDALARGIEAEKADQLLPRAQGEVNGIKLLGYSEFFNYWFPCNGLGYAGSKPFDGFSFGYLPPGTRAETPQQARVCPDGSIAGFGQAFQTLNTSFQVYFYSGRRALSHTASATRVSEVTIAGHLAVVIRPVTDEGFGQSWIAIATDNGVIVLDAVMLPLSESLKIAEGIQCKSC